MLYRTDSVNNRLIVSVFDKVPYRFGIFAVLCSYSLVKKRRKQRVSETQPTSVGYAVCNVCKLFGSCLIIVVEHRLAKDLRMKLRYAVHHVRARNRKICHSYLTVCNYRHTRYSCPIAGINVPEIGAKATVYFTYYCIYSGKAHAEQLFVPTFKRFGHYRMVCV